MSAGRGICGVDEAGRGPLAGPVYAAAVILPKRAGIDGLADSKTLAAPRREALALEIKERAIAWAVASASVAEIDTLNILKASLLAMKRAVEALDVRELVRQHRAQAIVAPRRGVRRHDDTRMPGSPRPHWRTVEQQRHRSRDPELRRQVAEDVEEPLVEVTSFTAVTGTAVK